MKDLNEITTDGLDTRIRRWAKSVGYIVQKSRKDGLWYFTNKNHWLLSPQQGLNAKEAWNWISLSE